MPQCSLAQGFECKSLLYQLTFFVIKLIGFAYFLSLNTQHLYDKQHGKAS